MKASLERGGGAALRGGGAGRAWPLPAIPILFQPRRGRILIAVGDVVPALPTDEGGEEPTGIGSAETTGMFGQRHKGQSGTLAGANQPVLLGLCAEGEQPCGLSEIVRDNMLQGGRRERGRRCAGMLGLNTSFSARWRDGGRGRGAGRVRRWGGLLVLGFLEGFIVFLKEGW